MRDQKSSDAFLSVLREYLASSPGRDTSPLIVERLRELDPEGVGMGLRPNLAHVHRARVFLEEVIAEEEQTQVVVGRQPAAYARGRGL